MIFIKYNLNKIKMREGKKKVILIKSRLNDLKSLNKGESFYNRIELNWYKNNYKILVENHDSCTQIVSQHIKLSFALKNPHILDHVLSVFPMHK